MWFQHDIPDEAQAKVVEQIYDMKLAGKSLTEIAEHLTAEGEYAPNDLTAMSKGREVEKPSPWAKSTVNRILRNPIYKGQRIYGGKRSALHVEPIIDGDVWRKVQVLLTGKSSNGGRPRTGQKPLLLGVIKCGACGGRMYRVYCGKDRIPYYRCHGLNEHVKGCGVMVRIADADTYAAEQVAGFFDQPHLTPVITPGELHTDEIEAVEREIQLVVQDLDAEDADLRFAELRAERQRLIKLDEAAGEYVDYVPTGKTKGEEWVERDQEGKRQFLLDYGCEIQVLVSKTRGDNGRERNLPLFSIAWRNYSADLSETA